MQHFIFTKFNMPGFKGNPHIDQDWLDFRIMLFKRWILPSMKQQTCQDFQWFVHCWHETPLNQVTELMELEESYDNLTILWLHKTEWYHEWLGKIRDRVEPGMLLTSRIDSDDAVHKEFVEKVQFVCGKYEPGYFFCFYKGIMHNIQSGKCYLREYFRNPFLSYLETSYSDAPRDIVTVHNRQHCHAEPVENVFTLPYWLQNVHGGNQGNQYDPKNKEEFDFSEIEKDFV